MKDSDMKLRPHHILDVINGHGHGIEYQPSVSGNSQYIVAPKLLSNLDLKIKLVLEADDICEGCKLLLPDGKCTNVLSQLTPSPSMQAYNDVLDCRLFDYLSIEVDSVMTQGNHIRAAGLLICLTLIQFGNLYAVTRSRKFVSWSIFGQFESCERIGFA